jgi:hypothetical protein
MSEQVRRLNTEGCLKMTEWLQAAKNQSTAGPPVSLLADPSYTEFLLPPVVIEREPGGKAFASRYEFGVYLSERFSASGKTSISRDSGLWNWLTLFFIDQLAPALPDGTRNIRDIEVYILAPTFKHDSYYRHAIRTAWLAAHEHCDHSKVLLIPAGKAKPGIGVLAHRGEIIEQIAARQKLMGSTTVIAGAERLYMDPATGRPKRGAAGAEGGSSRRLPMVLSQLDLTFDLNACTVDQFLGLLPKEFDRWKAPNEKSAA